MERRIVTLTGHRPQKLPCKFDLTHPWFKSYKKVLKQTLADLNPKLIITGMALGHDMWGAMWAYKNGVEYDAYIPFKGQEKRWNKKDRQMYHFLLSHARGVKIASEKFSYESYIIRDKWMVDDGDIVLALNSGNKSGTNTTVEYALKKGKEVINIWDKI